MRVSANISSNYLFIPNYREIRPFTRVFNKTLVETAQGWTYASYTDVQKAIIKDATYFDKIADVTRTFNNEQSLLHYLKLGLNGTNGDIIDASSGLILSKGLRVSNSTLGYQCDHIPVLYSLVPKSPNPNNVIVGFVGDYDFLRNVFHGQIQYQDVTTLWND